MDEDSRVDNPTNEEVVEDNDAGVRDIEDTEKTDFSTLYKFMDEMRARMDSMDASIRSLKDAQSITIDNGAIIRDDSEPETTDYVDTRTIAELDLSV